jgi:peptide/nickel transport system substrate-binding protein
MKRTAWVVAIVSIAAFACWPVARPEQQVSDQPRSGGVLNLPEITDFYDFDPTYNGSGTPNPDADMLANETLLGFKVGPDIPYDQMILQPRLAESWETSPDARTFTFHLRHGVHFASQAPVNGRELTADDVKFSIEYHSRTGQFKDSGLPKGQYGFTFEGLTAVETPDPYTVTIQFAKPFVPFLNYLPAYTNPILPKEIYQADGHFKDRMAGTGPFQLDASASQKGTRWVFKKNPNYWQAGKPYLDEVRYLVLPDEATRRAAFTAKQTDTMGTSGMDYHVYQDMKESLQGANLVQAINPQPQSLYISQRSSLMQDARVRKAVVLGIDYEEFNQVASGGIGGWPIAGLSAADMSQPEVRQIVKSDPNQAKQLLAQAGHPSGVDVTMYSTAFGTYGAVSAEEQLVQAQLKKVGFNTTIGPIQKTEWRDRLYSGDFSFMLVPEKRFIDPDSYFFAQYHSSSNGRWEQITDTKLDQLIEAQRGEPDPAKRMDRIKEMSRYLTESAYHSAVYRPVTSYPSQAYVQSYYPHWYVEGMFAENIWLKK